MKPVSEVITSPGTTKSFRSAAETDRDIVFLTVGNLMSTAMLLAVILLSLVHECFSSALATADLKKMLNCL